MKDRKGQYVFVAVLLLLVATISICYAVFFDKEEQLQILFGNWSQQS